MEVAISPSPLRKNKANGGEQFSVPHSLEKRRMEVVISPSLKEE